MKKILTYTLLVIVLLLVAGWVWLSNSNNFKRDGTFEIAINDKPIKINRDEYGIAYVTAETKADLIRGQAFVVAQDRLFQIEFYRALIKGELASLIGPSMIQSDIKMRVLNITKNAETSYQYLDDQSKNFLNWYSEGFNAYLRAGQDEFPVELSLLDITPKPISPVELIAVIHFIGFNHGQNLDDEILSMNLATKVDFAAELLPLTINPDRTKPLKLLPDSIDLELSEELVKTIPKLQPTLLPAPKLGSNNWAISSAKSAAGKPILANDPHLDARLLPGIFYPIGLFCPEFKGVGVALPGIPGLIVGRTEHVAFGVTNAYGDSQDLFIETVDQNAYLRGDDKIPFAVRKETISVKDSADVSIEIRSTDLGPVISDFEVFGIMTKDVVSLRWSLAETKSNSIGVERLMEAKNVAEFRQALGGMDNMFFNFVMADIHGNVAHQATGLVPIRSSRQGTIPQKADQDSLWQGFIPKDQLPHMVNPQRGWVGTANHDTRPDDYPFYYSSHFSPYYRYQRMKDVLSEDRRFDADDLWQLILDSKNNQAEKLAPIFIEALKGDENTRDLSTILQGWDYIDEVDAVGPTVYHVLYNELLNLILDDELPDELEDVFWKNGYYWNQRIDAFIQSDHPFLDNVNTPEKESLNGLIVQAGMNAKQILTERLGADQQGWTWGKIHTVRFVSPIRQDGFGSTLLGAEVFAKKGSNSTINRGGYDKTPEGSFETGWFSTFRMVADLNDDEKIMGALSGGSAARIFHPYYKSQLEKWQAEEWIPYWLSEERVKEHAKYELVLE
ncbi:MAG: penicillin acylase family protein [Bacteroidota bacterium]